MNLNIIGTSGVIFDQHKKNSGDLFKTAGNNTGNLIFQYAVNSILTGTKKFYNWEFNPQRLNEVGGVIVIPCANFAHPNFDLGGWADKLEKTKLPIVPIGLGAQIFDDPRELRLKPGTLRFLKIISERANKVWVRGFKTSEALSNLGISNTIPIGCPSNFINTDVNLGIKIAKKLKLAKNTVVLCPSFYDRNSEVELEIFSQYKNNIRSVIIQEPLSFIRRVREGKESAEDSNFHEENGFLKNLTNDELNLFDRTKTVFFNADAWLEYLKPSDFCIGTRIHGIMAAWQAGVPSIVNAFDERIGELAEIMCIPLQRFSGNQKKFVEAEAILAINESAMLYDENRSALARRAHNFLKLYDLEVSSEFSNFCDQSSPRDSKEPILYLESTTATKNINSFKLGILERYNEKAIQGWAKGVNEKEPLLLDLYINDEFICSRENNIYRTDLDQTIGFKFYLPEGVSKAGAVKLDVRCKNTQRSISNSPLIVNLHPDESKKVLIGAENYLFLTNDTNRTLDQISGRDFLSNERIIDWKDFFKNLTSLPDSAQVCFIVAPFKEVVYRRFLPDVIEISENRNIQIVKSLAKNCTTHNSLFFCYPIEKMQMLDDSFPKGDTHWNYGAAFLCLTECLAHFFGQDTVDVFYKEFFNGFSETYSHADLLSKLGGICIEKKQMPNFKGVVSSKFASSMHSQNTGKEAYYQFASAPVNKRCLVLHDSFGEWFSPLLSRFFSTVVFKWGSELSAEDINTYDFFIFQRAERFLTKPLRLNT